MKETVLKTLQEMGFSLDEIEDFGYIFTHEDFNILYMPDDNEEFLRFSIPNIHEVTEENRSFLLDIVNDVNMFIKYTKTCLFDDSVWTFYEHFLAGEEHLDDVIEHCILVLESTYYLFLRKIDGDDSLPEMDADDETNENSDKKMEE